MVLVMKISNSKTFFRFNSSARCLQQITVLVKDIMVVAQDQCYCYGLYIEHSLFTTVMSELTTFLARNNEVVLGFSLKHFLLLE